MFGKKDKKDKEEEKKRKEEEKLKKEEAKRVPGFIFCNLINLRRKMN